MRGCLLGFVYANKLNIAILALKLILILLMFTHNQLIMKNRTGYLLAIYPVLIVLGIYIVFHQRIATNPTNAGFWLILLLGISIGVSITRIAQMLKK